MNILRNLFCPARSGGRSSSPLNAALRLTAACLWAGVLLLSVATAQAAPAATPEKNAASAAAPAASPAPTTAPAPAQAQSQTHTPAPAAPAPQPAADHPVEVRELWTGSLYSSTYRVGVCFSAQGTVRGVVYLRLYNGKVDVYHIDGTVHDNEIEAHHSSGHSFTGRLVSPDTVEGVISLKNGMKIQLKGERTHNAALAASDCAPLDK